MFLDFIHQGYNFTNCPKITWIIFTIIVILIGILVILGPLLEPQVYQRYHQSRLFNKYCLSPSRQALIWIIILIILGLAFYLSHSLLLKRFSEDSDWILSLFLGLVLLLILVLISLYTIHNLILNKLFIIYAGILLALWATILFANWLKESSWELSLSGLFLVLIVIWLIYLFVTTII